VGVKDIKLNLSLRSKFLSHSKFIVPRLIYSASYPNSACSNYTYDASKVTPKLA